MIAATTPKGLRLHIGLFGRRNVGKSSLLNAITHQHVSIVSDHAGTTTDPVEKPMELLPLGPVLFIDTAGIDDDGGELGQLRTARTRQTLDRTDLAVIVSDGLWGEFEEGILRECQRREVPVVAAFTKTDAQALDEATRAELERRAIPLVSCSASTGEGIPELRQALLEFAPEGFIETATILADLVGPGEMAILVVPIDKEAPRGRIILPQVQAIRDLLDGDSLCLVVREHQLPAALEQLSRPPQLVVTDSQAFRAVAAATPTSIPMTSFSILFSRFKGDLVAQTEGALTVNRLRPGDRVLVAEACTHHPVDDDIGRVKIPRWLSEYVGGPLESDTVQGHDFPRDLSQYQLVVHCGACMWNRREMLNRILQCREAGVPITNYGLVIAISLGILDRALEPFPQAHALVETDALLRKARERGP